VLVTRLCEGQHVSVLQLPAIAAPVGAEEVEPAVQARDTQDLLV
jgi:hypothetical protein